MGYVIDRDRDVCFVNRFCNMNIFLDLHEYYIYRKSVGKNNGFFYIETIIVVSFLG